MEISLLLFMKISSLFIMMFMGYILVKLGKIKPEDSRGISMVLLYLVMPCVILNAFQVDYTREKVQGLILAFVAAVIVHVILFALTYAMQPLLKFNEVDKASVIYSNAGNLIIPIVVSVLGEEWVLYSSAYICVQLVLVWTHCNSMMCGDRKIDLKKILTNINIIAMLAGVILFISGLRFPSVIADTISSISGIVGPVSMFVGGILFAGIDMKKVFTGRRIYLVTALRMIIFPLIILIVFKITGLSSMAYNGETILLVSFLASIAPTASTVTQMSQIYDKDAGYASAINVITTVLCIVTMPLMVFLYMV